LREFARRYIAAVIQPQVLQPRRLVIAESNRSPSWPTTGPRTSGQRAGRVHRASRPPGTSSGRRSAAGC
jgi:hypothetical protein